MTPITLAMLSAPDVILLLAIVALLFLLPTVFWIAEIVDVLRRNFYEPNNKIIWLLVVILLHFVGATIYYFVGKEQGALPGEQRFV